MSEISKQRLMKSQIQLFKQVLLENCKKSGIKKYVYSSLDHEDDILKRKQNSN